MTRLSDRKKQLDREVSLVAFGFIICTANASLLISIKYPISANWLMTALSLALMFLFWNRHIRAIGGDYATTLYADGVHDDTAALQAMFEGKPVYVENSKVVVSVTRHNVKIIGARLVINRTLNTSALERDNREILFDRCHFLIDESLCKSTSTLQ